VSKDPKDKITRIALPASSIHYILKIAKEDYIRESSIEASTVIKKLTLRVVKMDFGLIAADYTLVALEDRKSNSTNKIGVTDLGGAVINTSLSREAYPSNAMYWKECYKKYIESPIECSISEIDGAKEHMYLEGLLSDTEMEAMDAKTMAMVVKNQAS